jgi:hypothetical protein
MLRDVTAVATRLRWLLAGALVLVAGLLLFVKPARGITLLAPSVAGFVQAAPDVWVERGASESTRDTVVRAVALGNGRVREFYGAQAGRAVVLACTSVSCFRLHGGIGHGTTYFGNRVLLGPSALSVVKVTHELSHVELAARVDALRVLLRVPQWFDEGLAVMISDDPAFDERRWLSATVGGTSAPDLGRLATLRAWLAVTRVDGQLSYGTARHEVSRWYARVGLGGLERLFVLLRKGSAFDAAYAATEGSPTR